MELLGKRDSEREREREYFWLYSNLKLTNYFAFFFKLLIKWKFERLEMITIHACCIFTKLFAKLI